MSSTASDSVMDLTDLSATAGKKAVLLFWAPWHEGSSGPMTQVLKLLADGAKNDDDNNNNSSTVVFGRVHAEEATSLSSQYQVTVVPTFVFLDENGKEAVARIEGGEDVAKVTQAVQQLLHMPSSTTTTATVGVTDNASDDKKQTDDKDEAAALNQRLERLIRSHPVMLFIKGTPDAPRCGFSRQAVEMLQDESVAFGSFDILTDDAVRQGLKAYADWPTYPQLYVHGELVGGLDILKEMKENSGTGNLKDELGVSDNDGVGVVVSTEEQEKEKEESLEDRLRRLVKRHRIMLFMKGLPSQPRCGFSRQMIEILEEEQVAFDAFDILQDEQVRQGLKEFSDWPTYPQLYVDGDLIGGLDIVKELKADGSLKETLGSSSS